MKGSSQSNPSESGLRTPVVASALAVLVVAMVGLWKFTRGNTPSSDVVAVAVEVPTEPQPRIVAREPERPPVEDVVPPEASIPTGNLPESVPAVPPAEVPIATAREWDPASGYTRQLVLNLSSMLTTGGPLTPERIEAWNQELEKLRSEGPKSVAAIREFLETNQDIQFSELEGAEGFTDASLRQSLLRVLNEVGGPEALEVSRYVLESTVDPWEIAMLAHTVETEAPGAHRSEVMAAIQNAMARAAGQPTGGSDLNPLFELLQSYGGSDAIAQLEGATGQWRYYASMALAAMPDGGGIPSLIRMADVGGNPSDPARSLAMSFLAQSAADYGDARQALLQQAQLNQIPESAWHGIAAGLSGQQYQFERSFFQNEGLEINDPTKVNHYSIRYGNQNYYTVNRAARWTAEQQRQQLALIDELLSLSRSPTATRLLGEARARLAGL